MAKGFGDFFGWEVWLGSMFLSVFVFNYFISFYYCCFVYMSCCVRVSVYYVLSVEFFFFLLLPSPEERRGEIRHALHTCYSIQVPRCHDSLRRMCHECVYIFSLFQPPCRKAMYACACCCIWSFSETRKGKKKVDIMKQLMHLVLTGRTGLFFPTPEI